MLYTYNTTSQTLTTNSAINFNANAIQTGYTATHAVGTTSISLNKPGFYMVSFNADAVESGTAGNVQVQLRGNGVAIPAAEATINSASATDVVNPSFMALVRVTPNCCANTNNVPYALTVVNTGVGATFTNVALTVTKVA